MCLVNLQSRHKDQSNILDSESRTDPNDQFSDPPMTVQLLLLPTKTPKNEITWLYEVWMQEKVQTISIEIQQWLFNCIYFLHSLHTKKDGQRDLGMQPNQYCSTASAAYKVNKP